MESGPNNQEERYRDLYEWRWAFEDETLDKKDNQKVGLKDWSKIWPKIQMLILALDTRHKLGDARRQP